MTIFREVVNKGKRSDYVVDVQFKAKMHMSSKILIPMFTTFKYVRWVQMNRNTLYTAMHAKSMWKAPILSFMCVPASTVTVHFTMDDFIQRNMNCKLKMNQTNPKPKPFNYNYCKVHYTQFHSGRSRSLGNVTYVRTSRECEPSYKRLTNVTLKHRKIQKHTARSSYSDFSYLLRPARPAIHRPCTGCAVK
jgi:hypothetical protein